MRKNGPVELIFHTLFIAFILAFVYVGDGLRDAADPYSSTKK